MSSPPSPCLSVFAHCHVASIYAAKAGPNKNKLRQFRVEHDEAFFDGANCRSCRCIDGDAICDAPQSDNCSAVVSEAEPENCTHTSGVEIAHGEVAKIGCNNCGCKDGRLKCTGMQRCIENKCTACRGQPQEIFCGPDNQNYRSQCEAVNCGMFSTVQLTRGPCQIQVSGRGRVVWGRGRVISGCSRVIWGWGEPLSISRDNTNYKGKDMKLMKHKSSPASETIGIK